jgi:hypothetical protein
MPLLMVPLLIVLPPTVPPPNCPLADAEPYGLLPWA